MTEMTDDEAIAMAVLAGCEFYQPLSENRLWFINSYPIASERAHPLEMERVKACSRDYGWTSRAQLARDFVAWLEEQNK